MKTNILQSARPCVAALGLSLAISGCAGGNQRLEADDPSRVSPNEFFEVYDRALAEPVPADGAKNFSTANGEHMRTSTDANQLAESAMRSWDGYVSAKIDARLNFVLASTNFSGGATTNRASDKNDDVNRKSTMVTLKPQPTDFQLASRLRHESGPWAQIAGPFEVATSGACPFDSGIVELAQHDFLIQGTRGGQVVLWGALGSDQLFVVANEHRFGKTGANTATGQSGSKAPDKPSTPFSGGIAAKTMTLARTAYRPCSFTLTRKG